jgi:hypothetical protein
MWAKKKHGSSSLPSSRHEEVSESGVMMLLTMGYQSMGPMQIEVR